MAKQDRTAKSGFVIKLSSETVQKLQEITEEVAPLSTTEIDTSTQANVDVPSTSTVPDIGKDTLNVQEKEISDDISESRREVNDGPAEVRTHDGPSEVKAQDSWGEYAPYVTYDGETAVYTDPTTKVEYIWSAKSNSWEAKKSEPQESSRQQEPERTYSYENDTHVYTESDGSKFFWDDDKKAWFPKVDDDFLAHYQMSYGFVDNTTKKEDKPEPVKKVPDSGPMKRKVPEVPTWFDASEDKNNTKVYVSNLPDDLTEEEFVDVMQKYGLVMRDPSNQKMKVKLYYDKESNCFKGDALCTYIKIESVELALNLLDGSDVRGRKISVQRAQFQLKGDYNPALKPKKKKKKELEKLKRMQQKLFDWRPEKAVGERSKNERVVIVKNLFEPSDFDKEVQLILDYQQDLREECGKCGEVRKVVLYDRHPEGVAQITMKEPEQADAAVLLINGRWFGKRKLSAEIWDGRTKYRIAETDADMNKRVDKWEKFLEGDSDKKIEIDKKAEGILKVVSDGKAGDDKEMVQKDESNITTSCDKKAEIVKNVESTMQIDAEDNGDGEVIDGDGKIGIDKIKSDRKDESDIITASVKNTDSVKTVESKLKIDGDEKVDEEVVSDEKDDSDNHSNSDGSEDED